MFDRPKPTVGCSANGRKKEEEEEELVTHNGDDTIQNYSVAVYTCFVVGRITFRYWPRD